MREKELRRSLAVLPIGTVMTLTDLTARQIRYYEKQELVHPQRNSSNRRMYSLDVIDKILEIKDYLAAGLNIAQIQALYLQKAKEKQSIKDELMSDHEARKILHDEIVTAARLNNDANDFFKNQYLF